MRYRLFVPLLPIKSFVLSFSLLYPNLSSSSGVFRTSSSPFSSASCLLPSSLFVFSFLRHRLSFSTLTTEPLPDTTLPPRTRRKRMQRVYEVCLPNAGNYVKANQIHRVLKENHINFLEVDKRANEVAGFVRFGSIDDMKHACTIIPTIKYKERIWTIGTVTGNRIKRTENEIDSRIRKYYNQHYNPKNKEGINNNHSTNTKDPNNHNARPAKRRPVYDEEGQLITVLPSTGPIPPNDTSSSSSSSSASSLSSLSSDQHLLNSILPWNNIPYEEQLRRKQADMQEVMRTMTEKIVQSAQKNADKKYKKNGNPNPSTYGTLSTTNLPPHKRKYNDITSASNDLSAKIEEVSMETSVAAASSILSSTEPSTIPDTSSPYPSTLEEFLPGWLKNARLQPQDPVCPLYPILPAPEPKHYRNKAQYTIGFDANNKPCVGFCIGTFENAAGVVEKGSHAFNIPTTIHQIADKVQQFIETSPLLPYNPNLYFGVWRQITIRWSRHGSNNVDEYMIDLLASPPGTSTAEIVENYEIDKNKNMEEFLRKHALLLKETIDSQNGNANASMGTSTTVVSSSTNVSTTETTVISSVEPTDVSTAPVTSIASTSVTETTEDNNDNDAKIANDERIKEEQTQIYKKELQRFVDCLKPSSSSIPNVTSIFLQEYNGVSHPSPNHPHILLYGNEYIREKMCDLSFDISPGAFFQVNVPIAEKLYYLARMFALEGKAGADKMLVSSTLSLGSLSSSSNTVDSSVLPVSHFQNIVPIHRSSIGIIDVCCGTGTIGLICSSHVGKVIGVELSQEAINDANRNTALNDIQNTKFICNKAESVMKDILNIVQQPIVSTVTTGDTSSTVSTPSTPITEVVAIVDPPRNGLHMDVIKALRTCKFIRRIVYVSCNPSGSLIEDTVKLCIPQEDTTTTAARGPEFSPVLALPVDMFPYTPHCEMIMLFERIQKHLPDPN